MTMTLKLPPPLSAQDKSSFAYRTIKDRLPVILVKVIDFLYKLRNKLKDYPEFVDPSCVKEAEEETKDVIGLIAKLRKELESNKSIELFEHIKNGTIIDDVEIWNDAIKAHILPDGSLPKWFISPWLLMECYMYRKLKECFIQSKHLKRFDPFVEQKRGATANCLAQMTSISDHMIKLQSEYTKLSVGSSHQNERKSFNLFMQLSLWANKADLSLSGMSHEKMDRNTHGHDLQASVDKLNSHILCDNLVDVWYEVQAIKNSYSKSKQDKTFYLDLVADNCGYELFVDLCLMHYLLLMMDSHKSVSGENRITFRLHVKQLPWFVSDVNPDDLHWLLGYLEEKDKTENVRNLAKFWRKMIEEKRWLIISHKFWTTPNDFSQMKATASDLHTRLEESSLVIFKGDLNYRKLTGDLRWNILTPFKTALRGFQPAPLVTLRTCKADVVVGIDNIETYAKINNNQLPSDWMISGDWGLIQFAKPN